MLLRLAFVISLLSANTIVSLLAQEGTLSKESFQHAPAPCMGTENFPLIEVKAVNSKVAEQAAELVLRFKAERDNQFYEVPFRGPNNLLFQAALPIPLPDAGRITYFVGSTKSSEELSPRYHAPTLIGGCPQARYAPRTLTNNISVRRTSDEQSPLPMGFSGESIESTATGGISRTTMALVALGGTAAGVAAVTLQSDDPIPVPVLEPPPPPPAIRACFTPDPLPNIDSGETIRFDATCTEPSTITSFEWDFGDGQTGSGSSVEHLFIPGGIYSVSLTVSLGSRSDTISRVVQVISTPEACFTTTPDPPRIKSNESISFNGECSVGDRDGGPAEITKYEWDFGDSRPGAEGRFVSRQFEPDVYGVTLTVTNKDGRQDSKTQFVVVEATSLVNSYKQRTNRTVVSFASEIIIPHEGVNTQARLSLNDSIEILTPAPSSHNHRRQALIGNNTIEARLISRIATPGRWRFNFNSTQNFTPGSLSIISGQLLSLGTNSITFRVTGDPSETILFRFHLDN